MRLILLFVFMPLVELAILVYLGTVIGTLYTILIVVATGFIGASMAKNQGMATLTKIRRGLESGIVPSSEFFDGSLILAGGLLLLTPGIITDTIGFALLVPPTRRVIAGWIRGFVRRKIDRGEAQYWEIR